jgi:cyclomaltodextrin glucanotransferase
MAKHPVPSNVEHQPIDSTTHLHLSDVECRGETIYFAVVDRFNTGRQDSAGKETELDDPTHADWHKYWGGDLQGILDKVDYLKELGVTALWLTPLFEQVEGAAGGSAPIHGYWTRDFKRVNERWVNNPEEVRLFATDTVLDQLIDELHKRNMKFILDIVCNHSSPATTQGKGMIYDDGKLVADFDNDVNNWYHHYGDVKDWNDQWQVQNAELCGLATFNENNTEYRRYIMGAIKMWLDKGVDALRIDTVKHMPNWFWQEFTSEMHTRKPGVFIFGEWIHNHPANPISVDFANHAGMSVFDFAMCQAIRDAVGKNADAGFSLIQEVLDQDGVYRNASELVTFYENHDMARFQSLGASNEMVDIATALIMTMRGIPCLYYLQSSDDGKVGHRHAGVPLHPHALGRAGQEPGHPVGRKLAEDRGEGHLRLLAQIPPVTLPGAAEQGAGAGDRPHRHRTAQRHAPVHPHGRENRVPGRHRHAGEDRRRAGARL